jgi:hypothetical protein
MVKRRVEPSVRIKKMSNWTLWRGRPPPKWNNSPLTTAG